MYKSFLEQLVRNGHLGEFIDRAPVGSAGAVGAPHDMATVNEVIHTYTVKRPTYNSLRANLQKVSQAIKVEESRCEEQSSKRP